MINPEISRLEFLTILPSMTFASNGHRPKKCENVLRSRNTPLNEVNGTEPNSFIWTCGTNVLSQKKDRVYSSKTILSRSKTNNKLSRCWSILSHHPKTVAGLSCVPLEILRFRPYRVSYRQSYSTCKNISLQEEFRGHSFKRPHLLWTKREKAHKDWFLIRYKPKSDSIWGYFSAEDLFRTNHRIAADALEPVFELPEFLTNTKEHKFAKSSYLQLEKRILWKISAIVPDADFVYAPCIMWWFWSKKWTWRLNNGILVCHRLGERQSHLRFVDEISLTVTR